MKADLFLQEHLVEYIEDGAFKGHATPGKLIGRKKLTTVTVMDALMCKAEEKYKYMEYWNDIRIFKLEWVLIK